MAILKLILVYTKKSAVYSWASDTALKYETRRRWRIFIEFFSNHRTRLSRSIIAYKLRNNNIQVLNNGYPEIVISFVIAPNRSRWIQIVQYRCGLVTIRLQRATTVKTRWILPSKFGSKQWGCTWKLKKKTNDILCYARYQFHQLKSSIYDQFVCIDTPTNIIDCVLIILKVS